MIYVTSDLHGYPLEKFKQILNEINFSEKDKLYILGDCIDRGKDGINILKWISSQKNIELLLGNHEDMLLACSFLFVPPKKEATDSMDTLTSYMEWMSNGGMETSREMYLLDENECIEIVDYLRECPLFKEIEINGNNFLLVHSGLGNFSENKNLNNYTKEELLWTRPDLETKYFDNVTVVFGHTPTEYFGKQYEGRAVRTDTWIDIDIGKGSSGQLILRLDDMKEFYFGDQVVENTDLQNAG